jgi:DNA polymerase-3 subunit beta
MISIQKEHLVPACRHLLRTTPRRPTLPELESIKITPAQGAILLTTTDLDRETTISIPAPKPIGLAAKLAAMRAKPILVPAEVLANCAKSADNDSAIHIAPGNISFQIAGQTSSVPVEGYNAESFPDSPQETEHHLGVCFDTDKIKRLLRAASTDETRYVLNGIYWEGEGNLVATDGRRLHKESAAPFQIGEHKGIIIPNAACKLIPERAAISLLAKGEEPPRFIAFTAQQGILTIRILSKLIEGNYPNYRQVIPEASGNSIRFDNTQAATALRKLATIAAKDSPTLMTPSPTGVTFSVKDKDGNLCGSFTQPAIIKGTPKPSTYNTKFLIDALENGGDCFDTKGDLSPALITGIKGNTHVLMPVRTTDSAPPTPPQETEEEESEEEYATN